MPTIYIPEKKKRIRKYTNKKNNDNFKYVYNSKQWRDLRLMFLGDNPLCKKCLENDIIRSAVEVHHIIPLSSEKNIMRKRAIGFDYNNLEALCYFHHHEIHDKKQMLK